MTAPERQEPMPAAIPPPLDCRHCRDDTATSAPMYVCTLPGWGLCVHSVPKRRRDIGAGRCFKFEAKEATP